MTGEKQLLLQQQQSSRKTQVVPQQQFYSLDQVQRLLNAQREEMEMTTFQVNLAPVVRKEEKFEFPLSKFPSEISGTAKISQHNQMF